LTALATLLLTAPDQEPYSLTPRLDDFMEKVEDLRCPPITFDNTRVSPHKRKEAKSKRKIREKREQREQSERFAAVATAYTARCAGCSGITATGIDVRDRVRVDGKRIIAVDPSVIPLGSIVEVTLRNGESFIALAGDTGGVIDGRRIDVLMSTKAKALNFGRQDVKLRIITKGDR